MKRALLCLCLLGTACGHSQPTRFYTLVPQPAASRVAYSGSPVRLEAVHMPPSVAGHRLLHGSSEHEVRISTLERWTDDLDYLLRQTLAQNLATRLPEGTLVYPDAPRPRGSLSWVVDVLSLREGDGKLTCEVGWTLMASDVPQLIERRQGRFEMSADGSGKGTSAAMSRLAAALADAMAQSFPEAASALAATPMPSASVSPTR